MPKPARFVGSFDTIPAFVMDGRTDDDSIHRASIGSRGKNWVKIGRVVPEICSLTHRHTHHNNLLSWRGRSNNDDNARSVNGA